MNRVGKVACVAAAFTAFHIAASARAQEPHASPSWDALTRCADMTDPKKELECYRAEMRQAGYRRNSERDAAEHRKSFGLELPSIKLGGQAKPATGGEAKAAGPAREAPDQDQNRVVITISAIAYTRPLNQIMIVTTDGAVWLQDDTVPVNFSPKAGDKVKISKTAFGGYFCDFGHSNAVRCVRKN